jgi:hypothetical protein
MKSFIREILELEIYVKDMTAYYLTTTPTILSKSLQGKSIEDRLCCTHNRFIDSICTDVVRQVIKYDVNRIEKVLSKYNWLLWETIHDENCTTKRFIDTLIKCGEDDDNIAITRGSEGWLTEQIREIESCEFLWDYKQDMYLLILYELAGDSDIYQNIDLDLVIDPVINKDKKELHEDDFQTKGDDYLKIAKLIRELIKWVMRNEPDETFKREKGFIEDNLPMFLTSTAAKYISDRKDIVYKYYKYKYDCNRLKNLKVAQAIKQVLIHKTNNMNIPHIESNIREGLGV